MDERKYEYSIGDGWKSFVDPLIVEVERLGGRIAQIKEKFGELRFYFDLPQAKTLEEELAHKRLDYLVSDAENRSAETCEFCGKPGELRSGNWLQTLCEGHHQERELRKLDAEE